MDENFTSTYLIFFQVFVRLYHTSTIAQENAPFNIDASVCFIKLEWHQLYTLKSLEFFNLDCNSPLEKNITKTQNSQHYYQIYEHVKQVNNLSQNI